MADNQVSLRCADADRERVASVLREHYAEGRLDLNEYQERTDAVYAAKTFGDLAPLTRDLPALPSAESPEQKDDDAPARAGLVAFVPLMVVLIACTAWMAGSVATGHSGALWPAFIVFFAIMGRRGCGGRSHRVR
ncbi:MAG: DUF1707 SHOCT-like domain-containing protein [Streptosporangiales bacterium]